MTALLRMQAVGRVSVTAQSDPIVELMAEGISADLSKCAGM